MRSIVRFSLTSLIAVALAGIVVNSAATSGTAGGNFITGNLIGTGVTPTLGNYPPASIPLSSDTTITPDAAPMNTTSISVSTSTSFDGTFAASPSTGVINVTNAHPAGTYTVTVKAFGPGGSSATKTFTLTVTNGTACAGTFTSPTPPENTVISSPTSVAIGDFNNDGRQDFAAVGNQGTTVAIRLGNNDGTFSNPVSFPAVPGNAHLSIAVGDLNGDGNQDLIIGNFDTNNVSVRLGNGDGTFASPGTEVSVGTGPYGVALGDFNGDGKPDIAAANSGTNNVSILLGNGDGTFVLPGTEVAVGATPVWVAIGDFTGDGNADFATANFAGAVSIRIGDGLGGFVPAAAPPPNVGGNPISIAIGDFNSDGKQDLATANYGSNTLSVRFGDGSGGFTTIPGVDVGVGSNPRSVAIGDFNNDGKQDLAAANETGPNVSIRYGDGIGGFILPPTPEYAVGSNPYSIAIGDVNADGSQDFLTANLLGSNVSVRLGPSCCSVSCPANQTATTTQCSATVNYPPPTVTGNCTPTCSPASGSSFAVGTTTVTCSVTDQTGNQQSCSFTVTVTETTPPTITCPSPVIHGTDPNQCSAVVTYSAPMVMDNCAGVGTPMCSPASGSVFAKGITTVNCSVSDASGNTANCSFTVTVNDAQQPTITCPAPVVQSTDPNVCMAVVTYSNATATDNCPNVGTPVCTPASGTTFQKGVTTVSCTVSDASNNSANCSFTVTINDTQAPSITCPAPITQSTDPNVCTAAVTFADPVVTDNCPPCNSGPPVKPGATPSVPGCSVVCVPASGSTFQKGVTTVTCTATDASNNQSQCSFPVTINDTQAPSITCPAPITQSTDPNVCTAVVTFTATATDNCPLGPTPIVCTPASGSTFQKGATTVSCTATDTSNNSANCSFTVTVNDTQAPSITCPANITQPATSGQCSAVVTYSNATATDNCPNPGTPSCVPASGSTFQKGVTTVTCSVSDASNNPASCTFTVTINDTQPPVITCPANVIKSTDPNVCTAVVTYANATATDNCPGVGTPVCTPASGTTFQKGVTTVTCTATDAAGNTGSCSFSVTVNDNQTPTLTCPNPIVTSTASGQCSAVVTYTTPTANDNCPGATVACSPASGATFPKGTTTVTCTATDTSSNTGSCSFAVTVNDNQPPSITCPNNITVAGTSCTVVTYTAPTPTDNCPGATASCLPASGTCFPVGTTTVTCTAIDASANAASCTFTVSVVPCTITCPANITKANDPGQCGAVVNYAPNTTAGCGSVNCTPASGSFFQKGTTTVTCTTTAGPSCSFTVTVNDTQPPNITCPANIVHGTDPNVCQAVVTYPAPVVSDNCPGVGAPTCSPASGSTFPKGTTTITCTVKDSSNNMSMCSFTVTVNDTQPPVFPNGCPAGITKAAQASCPFTTTLIVNYTTPVATDNCPPPPTVVCNPPSGSTFPPGTTVVTCTATDSSGNTAICTFPVNVYSFCLQDDSTDNNVVFVNAVTGAYLFCQNGVPLASGTGTLVVHGCNFQIDHTKGDRKVHIQGDTSANSGAGSGTAFIQKLGGGFVVQITDRKMSDDSCTCAPGVPPPAPSK